MNLVWVVGKMHEGERNIVEMSGHKLSPASQL